MGSEGTYRIIYNGRGVDISEYSVKSGAVAVNTTKNATKKDVVKSVAVGIPNITYDDVLNFKSEISRESALMCGIKAMLLEKRLAFGILIKVNIWISLVERL